jgi:hypothetical protein
LRLVGNNSTTSCTQKTPYFSQVPGLILPSLTVVQDKLVAKLVEACGGKTGEIGRSKSGHSMTDSILSVMGALAEKVSVALRPYISAILPLVVDAVIDPRTHQKHMPMAAHCLGKIVGSTGCVIDPYMRFPALLPSLLKLLDHEYPSELHVTVVELLGIMGALGPHAHMSNQVLSRSCMHGQRLLTESRDSGAQLTPTCGPRFSYFRF